MVNMRVSRPASLPAFVTLIALLLGINFIALILSTFAGVSLAGRLIHPNPLAAYEAIWPGQSIESVAAYARQTPEGRISCMTTLTPKENYSGLEIRTFRVSIDPLDRTMTCQRSQGDDIFRAVTVTIEVEQVQQLQLVSDVLPQDALFLYWGAPDTITRTDAQTLYLRWNRSSYFAVARISESGFIARMVTLTANG